MILPTPLKDRYEIATQLQQRGCVSTFLAHDHQTQQPVVIKVLDLQNLSEWNEVTRFEHEAKILKQLQHPQIPRFIDFVREEPYLYLLQEALPGKNLQDHLKMRPFTPAEVMRIAEQALTILIYLQSLNPIIIHRDLKPSNFLLSEEQTLSLIDFGSVCDQAVPDPQQIVGTFGYMPPEQAAGQAKAASDLYALGVSLLECLSGQSPQALGHDAQLQLQYPAGLELPPAFQHWLDSLLQADIKLRPQSAQEALLLLKNERPPEAIGRLRISYPQPEHCQIEFTPVVQSSSLQRGLDSLKHQFLPSLFWGGVGFAWMYTLSFFGSELLPDYYPLFASLNHPNTYFYGYWLLLAGLCCLEYQILQQAERPQRVQIQKGRLYFGHQSHPLETLKYIWFSPPRLGLRQSQTRLDFGKKGKIRLPFRLTPQEQQLFEHHVRSQSI